METLLLQRIHPVIEPGLAPNQAGFRWGADEQAWTLVETLRLGSSRARPCFVVFVDIRKAYDCVWRPALAFKLLQQTGPTKEWAVATDFFQ